MTLTEQIVGRALEAEDKHTKINNFILSRLDSFIDFIMNFIDKLIDDIPEYPGLHPKQCIQRTICESHKRVDKYGRVGKVIRFLFR